MQKTQGNKDDEIQNKPHQDIALPSIDTLLAVDKSYLSSHLSNMNSNYKLTVPSISDNFSQQRSSPYNSKYYPSESKEVSLNSTALSNRTVEKDMNEIIEQCLSLGKSMSEKRGLLFVEPEAVKPCLDDMIDKANRILNALLRLRKQQIAADNRMYTHHVFHHSEIPEVPKTRKRAKRTKFQGKCQFCDTMETPEWRRGPNGARTLCNACGLNYAKLAKLPQYKDDTSMK